jgi:cytochrome P450
MPRRNVVIHDLLSSELTGWEMSSERLVGELMALLFAGSTTTSNALTVISYYVLANPHIEERLRHDLQDIMAGYPDEMPSWAKLEDVHYLTACIKEGLRYVLDLHFLTLLVPAGD